jgi:hypothetical protein
MNEETFCLSRVLASKSAYRRQLAARPLGEKLHLLDELRERALAIHRAARMKHPSQGGRVSEDPARYDSRPRP